MVFYARNSGPFRSLRLACAYLLAQAACTVEIVRPPLPFEVQLEAEDALLAGPMRISSDERASGLKYVVTENQDQGAVTFALDLPQAGEVLLWARVLAATANQDSYRVSAGGEQKVFDIAEGKWSDQWQWTVLNGRDEGEQPLVIDPRILSLPAGPQTIVFQGREANACLDQIVVTQDLTFTPLTMTFQDGLLPHGSYAGARDTSIGE